MIRTVHTHFSILALNHKEDSIHKFISLKVFDDSLPKRPWDNFHFVEFHQITSKVDNPDLAFAVQSLLEIPDQYKKIKAMGLLNFPDSD